MRRNKRTILLALGVGGALLIGGSAFTNSLTATGDAASTNNQVVGYNSFTASGADVSSLYYDLSVNNTKAHEVIFTTTTDTDMEDVVVAFNGNGTDSTSGQGENASNYVADSDACSTQTTDSATTWTCTLTSDEELSLITEVDLTITPSP